MPARAISAHGTPTAIVVPTGSPFDRLRRYINQNRQRRHSNHSSRRGLKGAPVLGYIADGRERARED